MNQENTQEKGARKEENARESIFSGKQWAGIVVIAFFLATLSLNLSILLSARFTRTEIRKGFETEFIRLIDARGKKCGTLSAEDGGGLVLESRDGKSYLVLAVNRGEPALVFVDKEGKHRAAFSLRSSGEPHIKMAGRDGKIVWSAPGDRRP